MEEPSEKPIFNDFADAGRGWTIVVFVLPFLFVLALYLYCGLREPNCQEGSPFAHERKPQTDNPNVGERALDVSYKPNSYASENKVVERSAPLKCSAPCHIVNKALDDPVALFTGFLVYVVYFQVLFMLRQETWLRRSFKAASTSAAASVTSVRHSQETSMAELRAYVALDTIDHTNTRSIKIRIRNYGKTPAHHVAIVQTCFDTPKEDTYRHPRTISDDPLGNQMLHPGQAFDSIVLASKDGVCVDRVIDVGLHNGNPFYIYGRIDYMDIYRRYWITYFCQRYEPASPEGKRCVPHHHHNYEDKIREAMV